MLDDEDVATAWVVALFSDGWFFSLGVLIAIALTIAVCNNRQDCAAMHCRNGSSPKLMSHQCLCVERAE